jgi:hypothetical protein
MKTYKILKNYLEWNKLSYEGKLAVWHSSVVEYLVFDLKKVVGYKKADGVTVNRYNDEGWLNISESVREAVRHIPNKNDITFIVAKRRQIYQSNSNKKQDEFVFQVIYAGADVTDIY